jgi:hypothetical protein
MEKKIEMSPKRAGELTHTMYEFHYVLPDSKKSAKQTLEMDDEQHYFTMPSGSEGVANRKSGATLPMLASFILMFIAPIKMPDDSTAFNGPHLGLICVRIVDDLGILLYWTRLGVDKLFQVAILVA